MAIAPDTVHGGKQDLRGVSRLKPGEGMLSRGSASMGNRPVGEGLTGRGWNIPLPCRCVPPKTSFPCEQSTTPASRRFQRLLPPPAPPPAPSRGRAVSGDSPDSRARGSRNWISVRVIASTAERLSASVAVRLWGIAPWGRRLAGEGGGTSPSPVAASLVERLSPDQPHLPSPLSPQCRLAKNRMMPL